MKNLIAVLVCFLIPLSGFAKLSPEKIDTLKDQRELYHAHVVSLYQIYDEAQTAATINSAIFTVSSLGLLVAKALQGFVASMSATYSPGIIGKAMLSQSHYWYYPAPLLATLTGAGMLTYNGNKLWFSERGELVEMIEELDGEIQVVLELSRSELNYLQTQFLADIPMYVDQFKNYDLSVNPFYDSISFGAHEAEIIGGKMEAAAAVVTVIDLILDAETVLVNKH